LYKTLTYLPNIPAENFVINEPGDIEVNVDDEFFWITEPRRATIDQIRFNGTLISFPSVGDKYVFMSAVDADKQDNFYVISNQNSTVQKFDIRGTKLADAITGGFVLTATQTMEDISLGPADSESVLLVLAEKDKNKIIRFNSGNLTFNSSKPIDIEPTSVAADNDGFVYISNSSQIVTRLNADLTKNGTFNLNPSGNQGGMIDDMVTDSENNLYAADFELDRIYKYNLTDIGPNGFIGWLGRIKC